MSGAVFGKKEPSSSKQKSPKKSKAQKFFQNSLVPPLPVIEYPKTSGCLSPVNRPLKPIESNYPQYDPDNPFTKIEKVTENIGQIVMNYEVSAEDNNIKMMQDFDLAFHANSIDPSQIIQQSKLIVSRLVDENRELKDSQSSILTELSHWLRKEEEMLQMSDESTKGSLDVISNPNNGNPVISTITNIKGANQERISKAMTLHGDIVSHALMAIQKLEKINREQGILIKELQSQSPIKENQTRKKSNDPLADQKKQLEIAFSKIANQEETIKSLNARIEQLIAQSINGIDSPKASNNAGYEEAYQNQSLLIKLKSKLEESNIDIESKLNDIHKLHAKISALQSDNQALKNQNENLNNQLEEERQKLDAQLRGNLSRIPSDYQSITRSSKGMGQVKQMMDLQKQVIELQGQLQETKERGYQEVQEQIQIIRKEFEEREREIKKRSQRDRSNDISKQEIRALSEAHQREVSSMREANLAKISEVRNQHMVELTRISQENSQKISSLEHKVHETMKRDSSQAELNQLSQIKQEYEKRFFEIQASSMNKAKQMSIEYQDIINGLQKEISEKNSVIEDLSMQLSASINNISENGKPFEIDENFDNEIKDPRCIDCSEQLEKQRDWLDTIWSQKLNAQRDEIEKFWGSRIEEMSNILKNELYVKESSYLDRISNLEGVINGFQQQDLSNDGSDKIIELQSLLNQKYIEIEAITRELDILKDQNRVLCQCSSIDEMQSLIMDMSHDLSVQKDNVNELRKQIDIKNNLIVDLSNKLKEVVVESSKRFDLVKFDIICISNYKTEVIPNSEFKVVKMGMFSHYMEVLPGIENLLKKQTGADTFMSDKIIDSSYIKTSNLVLRTSIPQISEIIGGIENQNISDSNSVQETRLYMYSYSNLFNRPQKQSSFSLFYPQILNIVSSLDQILYVSNDQNPKSYVFSRNNCVICGFEPKNIQIRCTNACQVSLIETTLLNKKNMQLIPSVVLFQLNHSNSSPHLVAELSPFPNIDMSPIVKDIPRVILTKDGERIDIPSSSEISEHTNPKAVAMVANFTIDKAQDITQNLNIVFSQMETIKNETNFQKKLSLQESFGKHLEIEKDSLVSEMREKITELESVLKKAGRNDPLKVERNDYNSEAWQVGTQTHNDITLDPFDTANNQIKRVVDYSEVGINSGRPINNVERSFSTISHIDTVDQTLNRNKNGIRAQLSFTTGMNIHNQLPSILVQDDNDSVLAVPKIKPQLSLMSGLSYYENKSGLNDIGVEHGKLNNKQKWSISSRLDEINAYPIKNKSHDVIQHGPKHISSQLSMSRHLSIETAPKPMQSTHGVSIETQMESQNQIHKTERINNNSVITNKDIVTFSPKYDKVELDYSGMMEYSNPDVGADLSKKRVRPKMIFGSLDQKQQPQAQLSDEIMMIEDLKDKVNSLQKSTGKEASSIIKDIQKMLNQASDSLPVFEKMVISDQPQDSSVYDNVFKSKDLQNALETSQEIAEQYYQQKNQAMIKQETIVSKLQAATSEFLNKIHNSNSNDPILQSDFVNRINSLALEMGESVSLLHGDISSYMDMKKAMEEALNQLHNEELLVQSLKHEIHKLKMYQDASPIFVELKKIKEELSNVISNNAKNNILITSLRDAPKYVTQIMNKAKTDNSVAAAGGLPIVHATLDLLSIGHPQWLQILDHLKKLEDVLYIDLMRTRNKELVSELESQLNTLHEENQKLKSQLYSSEQEYMIIKGSMNRELINTKRSLDNAIEQIKLLERQLSYLHNEGILSKHSENLSEELQLSQELEKKNLKMLQDEQEKRKTLELEINEMNMKLNQTKSQYQQLFSEATDTQTNKQILESRTNELLKQLEINQLRVRTLETIHNEIVTQLDRLTEQLSNALAQNEEEHRQVIEAQTRIEELQNVLMKRDSEEIIQRLPANLDDATRMIRLYQQRADQYQVQLQRRGNEIINIRSKRAEDMRNIIHMKAEIQRARNDLRLQVLRFESSKEENDVVRKSLAARDETIRLQRREIERLRILLISQNNTKDAIRNSYKMNNDITVEIEETKTKIKAAKNQLSILSSNPKASSYFDGFLRRQVDSLARLERKRKQHHEAEELLKINALRALSHVARESELAIPEETIIKLMPKPKPSNQVMKQKFQMSLNEHSAQSSPKQDIIFDNSSTVNKVGVLQEQSYADTLRMIGSLSGTKSPHEIQEMLRNARHNKVILPIKNIPKKDSGTISLSVKPIRMNK